MDIAKTKDPFRIGGTDAATIMGANKFQTLLELWQIKTGRRPKPDLKDNEKVQWGIRLEAPVLAAVLEKYGIPLDPTKQQIWLEDGIRVGYLDYQPDEDTIIEIKTAGQYSADEWEHGIPEYYLWQIVHYFGLTKATKAIVACLIGGQKLVIHELHRDDELIKMLHAAEAEFYRLCKYDTEPEQYVNDEPVQTFDMDAQVESLAIQYVELNKGIKAMETNLSVVKKALSALVGQNREQVGESFRVSYKYIPTSKVDLDLLCEENKIDKAKYTTSAGYFRLDVKEKK